MHRYPTQFKALEIKTIIVSELTKTIGKANHVRVYHLSDRDTQQYINAILDPVLIEYIYLISDLATREVW